MTDDRDQMRTALAKVVEQAPEPPTVDEIAERIEGGPAVRVDVPGRDAAPPGVRWARVALAAAVVLAVLAVGAVMVTGGDGDREVDVAAEPGAIAAPAAAVPATPPPGYALIWASDTSVGGAMLRYGSELGPAPLVVRSSAVEAGSEVLETGESGSIERWGDRDVAVTEDGRRARFADPFGLLVEVTGEPADVAAVVPTLVVKGEDGWRMFLEEVSTDIESLPKVAGHDLLDGAVMGTISASDGATTIRDLVVSLHGDPVAEPANRSGVAAGTCLTVGEVATCRPTDPQVLVQTEASGVQTSQGVLVDGTWWEFGWSTSELTGVTVIPEGGSGDDAAVRWSHDPSTAGGDMSWYAVMVPEATRITVELDGSGGFEQPRPAT